MNRAFRAHRSEMFDDVGYNAGKNEDAGGDTRENLLSYAACGSRAVAIVT